jgi:hypothetical protein
VLDPRRLHLLAHHLDKLPEPPGATSAHASDGRRNQRHAEQLCYQFGQAVFGQKVVLQQVVRPEKVGRL